MRGLPAPRRGRAPLFAYRGLRLPPPSRGRIPLGLAGVRRAGLPRACECACGHSLAVLCLPRGGAPPRVPLPRAVRAAVSRPLPSRVAAGGGVRARVGPLSPGGCFPWVVTPGWTRRMDGGSAGPLRRGSRGVFGSQPWWGLVRGGGPAKGAEAGRRPGRRGTALMLVAVGSRARLPGGPVRVFVGARPSPEPLPPRAPGPRPPCAPSPSPPTHPLRARLDQMAEGTSCPRSALLGPKPASPLLGVVPSPAATALGGWSSPGEVLSAPREEGLWSSRVQGGWRCCACGRAFWGPVVTVAWWLWPEPREVARARRGPGRHPRVPRDRPCAGGLGRWDPVCPGGRPRALRRL